MHSDKIVILIINIQFLLSKDITPAYMHINNIIHANKPSHDEFKKPMVNMKLIMKNKLYIIFKFKELFIFNIIVSTYLAFYIIFNSLAIKSITLFNSL